MAYVLSVSIDAIRQSRHRLRKKIGPQSSDTALGTWLFYACKIRQLKQRIGDPYPVTNTN